MIPCFEPNTGYLPVGEHASDWPEFHARFGWNPHRLWLLSGLRRMAMHLHDVGCSFLLVDGSFVTAKDYPSDYDACCDYSGIDVGRLDLTLMGSREEIRSKYRGELFPEHYLADDEYTFREFFQTDKDDRVKGVVRLLLETVT